MPHRLFVSTLLLFATTLSAAAMAQHAHRPASSPYAGEQGRPIKSLSADDVSELRRGGGWGLAKAAELNGMPGPAHVLELKVELGLSAAQVAAVEAEFAAMQAAARIEGERLIALELALEEQFRARSATDSSLREALARIGESRTRLRFIHLAAHLRTPALLSEAQVARYNALRGYAADPCANVPAGHDPAMWRRHNGCK